MVVVRLLGPRIRCRGAQEKGTFPLHLIVPIWIDPSNGAPHKHRQYRRTRRSTLKPSKALLTILSLTSIVAAAAAIFK